MKITLARLGINPEEIEVGAIVKYYPSGKLWSIVHLNTDGRHQDPAPNVPAIRFWYESGAKMLETHYLDGQQHGRGRSWHEFGVLALQTFHNNGRLQNPNPQTPALQSWGTDGEILVTFNY